MATNTLYAYLNDGFDEDFITNLIDYIKNKPGTNSVTRDNVTQDGKNYDLDLIKIDRVNHLSMYGGTSCRLDPPQSNVTVNEYGDWLCDTVDEIM